MDSSNQPLSGQVAVVTGGARGIGAAIAERLALLGAATVITARSQPSLQRTAENIRKAGGNCEPVVCDVTSLADVDACAAQVQKQFGRIDILVNNAGVGSFSSPLHLLPPEEWDKVMNTN